MNALTVLLHILLKPAACLIRIRPAQLALPLFMLVFSFAARAQPPLDCEDLETDDNWSIAVSSAVPICVSGTRTLTLTTSSDYANDVEFTYEWQSSTGGPFTPIASSDTDVFTTPTITQTTSFQVVITCDGGVTELIVGPVQVVVSPAPTGNITSANTSICNGQSANVVIAATGTGPFTGTLTNGGGAFSGNSPITKAVSPTSNTTYQIATLQDANGCAAVNLTGSMTVTVNPRPTGTIVSAVPNVLCAGQSSTISLFFTGTAPFSGSLSNGASFSNVNTNSATINITPPSNVAITLTSLSDANCTAIPADLTGSATITVNPVPVMDPISVANQCNGLSVVDATIEFGTNLPNDNNTIFTWTCNPNIGFGTGNNASHNNDINTWVTNIGVGTTPVTAVLTVTPGVSGGCTGQPLAVNITVNPTPTLATPTVAGPFCAGVVQDPIPFTGPVSGTVVDWIISQKSSIGFGTSADNVSSIPSFTATIPGGNQNTPITVNLVITPEANGCQGSPVNIPVTVNPRPTMCTLPDLAPVCSGVALPAVNFDAGFPNCTNNVDCPGCTFTWTSVPPVGYGASGTGNLPSAIAIGEENVVNANISVTATTAQGCVSASPEVFQVTINPGPSLTTQPDLVFCEGEAIPAVCLTSGVPGAAISWSVEPPTSIGFGVSGTNCTPSGTAANFFPFELNSTVTVTWTAEFEGCTGFREYEVTVIPDPSVNQPSNLVMCENISGQSLSEVITLTGSSIANNYTWSTGIQEGIIGLTALSGQNTITVIPQNSTPAAVSDNIAVTPSITQTINGITRTCAGVLAEFEITVLPRPEMNEPNDPSLCSDVPANSSSIPLSADIASASFGWQTITANVINLPADSGVGIPNFTPVNSGNTSISTTLEAWGIFTQSSVSCPGDTVNVLVSVFPRPNNGASAFPEEICSGEALEVNLNSATTPATTWIWTSSGAGISGNTNCNSSCNDISDVLVNASTSNPANATYTFQLALTGTNCTRTVTGVVAVNPAPPSASLESIPDVICQGSEGVFLTGDSSVPGVNFTWSSPVPGVEVIAGGPQGANAYVNLDPELTGNVIINVSSINSFGCTNGSNQTITITPSPDPNDYEVVWLNEGTEGATLVVLPFDPDVSYQWGRTPIDSWAPQEITGQTGQSFLIGQDFNPNIFLYWVEITEGDCVTRIFLAPPVGLDEEEATGLWSLYPNPADQWIRLVSESGEFISLEIVDAAGRLCYMHPVTEHSSSVIIPLERLPSGYYFIRGVTSDNARVVAPFIRN